VHLVGFTIEKTPSNTLKMARVYGRNMSKFCIINIKSLCNGLVVKSVYTRLYILDCIY